jgi:Flp pilus assembly protein TadG
MLKKLKFFNDQKAQSLVEFALVVPVFVIILFGVIEFARMFETMNVVTSAAREGVRVAAVTAPDGSRVHNAAMNVLNAGGVTGTPSITIGGPGSGNMVTVTVSVHYTPLTGSIIPGLGSMQITRSAVMRWES